MNIGTRIVLFFHWLMSLIALVMLAFSDLANAITNLLDNLIGIEFRTGILIALAILYIASSAATAYLLFKRSGKRGERGFITVDSSDSGKVRIAVGAVEQMVKQAAGVVDGVSEMRISISGLEDAIAIDVNITLAVGSHVPTVTMNMQRAIRQFVEMNCGVAVRSVSINVQSIAAGSGDKYTKPTEKAGDAEQVVSEPIIPVIVPEEHAPVEESAAEEMQAVLEETTFVPEETYAIASECEAAVAFDEQPVTLAVSELDNAAEVAADQETIEEKN